MSNAGVLTDSATESASEKGVPRSPNPQQDAQDEGPVRDVHGARWVAVLFSIFSSVFLFALDNTVVADVQPNIVETFGSVGQIAWLGVAFVMAATAMNLLFGQLYANFAGKWLYIGATVIFEVGSAICGAAPSMNALIVGRALAGLGGIGMYLGVFCLISAMTTIKERPTYVGMLGLTWGVGTILGPVVGGGFAESRLTWRWAFYINLLVFALAAPIYLFLLPNPDPRPNVPRKERFKAIDFVGAVIVVGAIICFAMAINFGGIIYEWNSGSEIALFVVAGVLFIAFGIQQSYSFGIAPEHRLFPVEFLTGGWAKRTPLIMFITTAAGGTVIFLPVYFLPLFFQFTRGDSAIDAAVRLLPFISVLVFFIVVQGVVLSLDGLYMPWFLAGGLVSLAGSALMYAKVDAYTPTSNIYGYTVLVGAGAACYAQAGFSIAQATVPKEMAHVATAFIGLAQTGGITIALAIANSVFINRAKENLMELLPEWPEEVVEGLIAGVAGEAVATLSPEQQQGVVEAVVDALSQPWILCIVAGTVSVVASAFMKSERLFIAPAAIGG